jgi:hypothetical protein
MACGEGTAMAETRKLAAFLRRMWSDSASLPGPNEERTLARLRAGTAISARTSKVSRASRVKAKAI